MNSFKKSLLMLAMILLLGTLLIACGTSDDDDTTGGTDPEDTDDEIIDEDPDPVTLTVAVPWDENMFNERFKGPIEEAYDYITLEHINTTTDRNKLEELFAGGTYPDILFNVSQADLEALELDYDLTEIAEELNYDFSHINSVILESIRARDPEGRLLSLPYEVIYQALFYNKNIFDAFGIDYPTPDMTWEDAIDLAAKVSGQIDGVNYRGLDFADAELPTHQFSLNRSDPETGEVLLTSTPEFSRYMELVDDMIELDNESRDFFWPDAVHRFVELQTTAMLVEFVQGLNWWSDTPGLDFAVTAVPVWEEGFNHRLDNADTISIAPYSEEKEAAFRVITHFTETEYQTWASRQGIGPVVDDTDVLDEFFQAVESTHDQNVKEIFAHPYASPPAQISRWDEYVWFNNHDYGESGADRNEWLRIQEETAEAAIADAKASE